MSIDTTFQPKTLTTSVGLTATQIGGTTATGGAGQQVGVTTFRIRYMLAANTAAVLGWGPTAALAVATAPAANAPANALTFPAGSLTSPTVYLELPYGTFFISSVALAFEITGGMGGCGG